MQQSSKKKSWLWWIIFGVILGGAGKTGIDEMMVTPVAEAVADKISENTSIDD